MTTTTDDFDSRLRKAYEGWEIIPKPPLSDVFLPSYKEGFRYAEEKGVSIEKMMRNILVYSNCTEGDLFASIDVSERDTFKEAMCIMSPMFKQLLCLLERYLQK